MTSKQIAKLLKTLDLAAQEFDSLAPFLNEHHITGTWQSTRSKVKRTLRDYEKMFSTTCSRCDSDFYTDNEYQLHCCKTCFRLDLKRGI